MTDPELAPRAEWTGGLLVGGASRRMGTNKLELRAAGTQLLTLPAQALRSTCAELLALGPASESRELPDGFTAVLDARPAGTLEAGRLGPMAGLVSALEAATTPWLLLCAADLPQVTPQLLRGLQEEAEHNPGRACMPMGPDGPEPAVSAWPTALAAELRMRFEAGRRSLQRALPSERLHYWPEAQWRTCAAGSEVFLNLNTPQQWESWSGQALGTP